MTFFYPHWADGTITATFSTVRAVHRGIAILPPDNRDGSWVGRAQGTEARRVETAQTGSIHDGPVGEADAPKL